MHTIMISYDLNRSGKNYEDVTTYIKSLGSWAKPLRSQWLVRTDIPVVSIIDGLHRHGADSDDALLVVDVTEKGAAWSNLSPAVSTWIKSNL